MADDVVNSDLDSKVAVETEKPPTLADTKSEVPIKETATGSTKPHKTPVALVVALVCLILFGVGGALAWQYVYSPKVVIGKAVTKLSDAKSLSYSFVAVDDSFKSDGKLFFADGKLDGDKLSEVTLDFTKVDTTDASLRLALAFDQDNFYLLPTYSTTAQLETEIAAVYPPLLSTQTYALAKPVLFGEKWLHIDKSIFPQTTDQGTTTSNAKITPEQAETLKRLWLDSFKLRKYNLFYHQGGKVYTRITVGFDKAKLLTAINGFKELDVDVQVSQINALVKLVEASDNWNSDIFELLIDSSGHLAQVTISFPEISQADLEKTLAEGTKDDTLGSIVKGLPDKVTSFLQTDSSNGLVEVGMLKFTDYDTTVESTRPIDVVAGSEILAAAQTELGPVIAAILTGGLTPQTTLQGLPSSSTTVATPKVSVPNCTVYAIYEGPFASAKCYTSSDYQALAYYLGKYQSAEFTKQSAQKTIDFVCDGSDFFAQNCTNAQAQKASAESDLANYTAQITAILARGK